MVQQTLFTSFRDRSRMVPLQETVGRPRTSRDAASFVTGEEEGRGEGRRGIEVVESEAVH